MWVHHALAYVSADRLIFIHRFMKERITWTSKRVSIPKLVWLSLFVIVLLILLIGPVASPDVKVGTAIDKEILKIKNPVNKVLYMLCVISIVDNCL